MYSNFYHLFVIFSFIFLFFSTTGVLWARAFFSLFFKNLNTSNLVYSAKSNTTVGPHNRLCQMFRIKSYSTKYCQQTHTQSAAFAGA